MADITELQSELAALEEDRYATHYAMVQIEFCGETTDPAAAAPGRAEAMAAFEARDHEALTSDATGKLLEGLAACELDEVTAAKVRVLGRDRAERVNVPVGLARELSREASLATVAWKQAKQEDDFSLFAPHLARMLELTKAQAHAIDPERDPYDVLLSLYEPGTSRAFYDGFFDELRAVIVPLVKAVSARPQNDRSCVEGYFDEDAQWELGIDLVTAECLPQDKVVYGRTEHPFSDGIDSSHVFIATHVYADDVMSNVYSIMHEGGHALYEAGVDPAFDRTCLRGGTSMGMHESQSRFYENMVGRNKAFMRPLLALMAARFPKRFNDVTPAELYRAVNTARPSLVRTEADELTYALHIMVRYEIEQMLFSGKIAVDEVPATWNALYGKYLGIEVPDDRRGCLQDTHWAQGSFGYFPTYALGSAWAAQLYDAMAGAMDVDEVLSSGDLKPVFDWLEANVWRFGRSKDAREIVKDATGSELDASHYTGYLARKFCDLYGLDASDFIGE